jgi:hypothetical protein
MTVVEPELPVLPDRDRVLLLTSEIEVFALQLESLAVRHPQLASECAELSGRMRDVVREHRSAVRAPTADSPALDR